MTKLSSRFRILALLALLTGLALAVASVAEAVPAPNANTAKKRTKRDLDGDGIPNKRDKDVDGDRKRNGKDRDIDGDRVRNPRDKDMDADALRNPVDPDMDGDGLLNINDPDPDGDGKVGYAAGVLPPAPPPVKQPRSFFGVVNEDQIDRRAPGIAATGVGTMRVVFDWSRVETVPGGFNFDDTDFKVRHAAEAGLTLQPTLFGAPVFRSSAPAVGAKRGTYPPASNADFAEYARRLVERYGPGGTFWRNNPSLPERPIRAWQVWNEPNLDVYWPSGPNGAAYGAMLREVGGAIKSSDPRAEIVTAGIPNSRIGVAPDQFMRGVYSAAGRGTFDSYAINAYATTAEGVIENIVAARKVLDSNGDTGAGIRVSEFGWADTADGGFGVGPARQAELIRDSLRRMTGEANRLGLRGVLYYNYADSVLDGGRDFWALHTGLLNVDDSPKAAHGAFSETVQSLATE